jgi:hypothetical protein
LVGGLFLLFYLLLDLFLWTTAKIVSPEETISSKNTIRFP